MVELQFIWARLVSQTPEGMKRLLAELGRVQSEAHETQPMLNSASLRIYVLHLQF